MKRPAAFTIAAILCACATPPAESPHESSETEVAPKEPPEVTLALESARNARTRARALTAPVYRGSGEPKDSLQFLQGELAEWVKERRALQDTALAAYEKAESESPLVAAYASMEAGELHAEFVDSVVQSTLEAMPRGFRDDPAQKKSFESSVRSATEPQLSRVRALFSRCVDSAKRATHWAIENRCAKRLAVLPPKPESAPVEPGEKLPDAPPRKWIDTREVRGCVFSGSLSAYVPLYAKRSGDETVAHASSLVPLEIAELEPAPTVNQRMRVDVVWPIRGSWWLAPNAEILALGQRENIVPKHIWLEPGTKVVVERRNTTSLDLSVDFTQGGRKLEPKSFKRTVSCKTLRLAYYQASPPELSGDDMVPLVEDGAPFFDSPKGKVVGRLAGGDFFAVKRLETQGDFTHVTGQNLFAFDGWVESSRVKPNTIGMIGLLPSKPYSHVVHTEVPLRAEPKADAPVVATLARDAYVIRRRTTGEFVEVLVLGLGTVASPARFYAETSAFDASATAAVK